MIPALPASFTLAYSAALRAHEALALWLLAPQNGFRPYLRQQTDTTFESLYRWNSFDLMLLIPYFAVMVMLAIYGVHRYQMVWMYFKHKKNFNPEPPQHFAELPMVT